MRTILLIIVGLALAFTGCKKQSTQDEEKLPTDVEVVTARVQEIYDAVFGEYNRVDSLRNLDQLGEAPGAYAHLSDFGKNYCSREWNQLLHQINEIDSLYHSGEMGFWEADYWIMGQDWHNLSISDLEVLSVTPNEAAVQFQLHNLDTVKPIALLLVKEDDSWKIDNFKDIKNDFEWKKAMQQYVTEENSKIKK